MTAVLSAQSVSFRRGSQVVLDDVTAQIAEGEVVALLGPSGSGKSSLVRIFLGLEVPHAGVVQVRGQLASKPGRLVIPPERRALAVVFQDLALWPHMTVAGNLGFALAARGVPRPDAESRIDDILEQVGLTNKAKRKPSELSGGEQQRVAIARALVLEPTAVLLDEPLANLDPVLASELAALFQALFAKYRTAVLYVTHNPREIEKLAHRIAVLEDGRITQAGTLDGLRAAAATPFIARVFCG